MRPLSLLLLIHHSAPVGEEHGVVARAVEQAYRPLLEALWAFPTVKLALHLSGGLPDWLEEHDPAFLDRLRPLVARGQVEMLGGLHYGAVPHAVPERDAIGQLQMHSLWLQRRLDAKARAAWLAEGAWDGSNPRVLARAGLQLTFLDEGLLRGTGSFRRMDGWYTVEREGAAVGVLPIHRRFSSMLPWSSPRHLLAELQQQAAAGQSLVVAAIPGERLGVHPHSLRWCWARERGWVRRFFEMLVAQDFWLRLSQPSQVMNQYRPGGRIFPASGTPPEVGVHALDAAAGRIFDRVQQRLLDGDAGPVRELEPWLLGPPWEAFLARHDEANRLHKRMLRTSLAVLNMRRVARETESPGGPRANTRVEGARRELYRAQCAAAYHGAEGGGLLRGEVRHSAWLSLLRAEQTARELLGDAVRIETDVTDHDCDGQREVVVSTPHLTAVVQPGLGGSLGELGLWGIGNVLNTFSRGEELWHEALAYDATLPALISEGETTEVEAEVEDEEEDVEITAEATEPTAGQRSGTVSEMMTGPLPALPGVLPRGPALPPLEPDLERLLWVDRHSRAAFKDHFLGPQTTLENIRRGQFPQTGDFADAAYQIVRVDEQDGASVSISLARDGVLMDGERQHLLRISKRYHFWRDRAELAVRYELSNRLPDPIRTRFAVETSFNLDSARTDDRYLEVPGYGFLPLDDDGEIPPVQEVHLVYRDLGLRLRLQSRTPALFYYFPIEIPVRSRLGYICGFQGTALLLAWDLSLWGHEKTSFELTLSVEKE